MYGIDDNFILLMIGAEFIIYTTCIGTDLHIIGIGDVYDEQEASKL